ncbi:glycosyltransferase family 2 protein [Bradyrhizobium sp. BWA-3-5]|uniref:glycosyltransferase family 2 protein n=1 Tax=Bradyrhizobium sp. BWA-3-5 TaxID=3080013 RepID=UPI00293E429E|nr:glycosyltransferase [Bradyrhizobium sp. BWA-3-5]WOH68040.1 glycosyltransferase [Bradyrhizobium sp. BWA-3-5]
MSEEAVEFADRPDSSSRNPMTGKRLRIAVGIATAGRKAILDYTLGLIARQTRLPDALIVCPATPDDLNAQLLSDLPFRTSVRTGKRGLTAQRNQILAEATLADVIVFFDDDFFPQLNYIEEIERLFVESADVVAITGRPIIDGANGPGVEAEVALKIIADDGLHTRDRSVEPTYGTYGCNMAFRMGPVRELGLSFDENLPLYGWQEDIDFSRQLSGAGRIIDAKALRGVHLGAKGGRTSGVRFGYSQIANPVYLIRKGTVSFSFAGPLLWRNVLANLARSVRPEPWIDRRGRLRGNCMALGDFLAGRIAPQRILELD